MTLEAEAVRKAAQEIDEAERTRTQIGQLSLRHPDISIPDAYAIQRAWIDLKVARGQRIVGHKVGLTSKAMQRTSQINEPDFGTLMDTMLFQEGTEIPFDLFVEPRVEVEVAFVIGKDLKGPDCTIFDILDRTAYVLPSVEIIDARIERFDRETKRPRKVMDTISDNAANAGLVLGGRPMKPDAIDLRRVSGVLYRNAVVEESGVAAAVLNHPANGIAWLANKLADYDVSLSAGQVVLSGSFTAPVAVRKDDTFHADFADLGAFAFRFV